MVVIHSVEAVEACPLGEEDLREEEPGEVAERKTWRSETCDGGLEEVIAGRW